MIDFEKLASAAGISGTRDQLEAFAKAIAARCADFCRDEASMRREGGLTFPLERNPPYIRGGVRGATACAVRIEEEFGIAKHGGPNG